MAARIRKTTLSDSWKEKIQAGVIMSRLLGHVNGEIEMSQSQVNAAKILLSKTVPDLNRAEIVGEGGGAIVVEIVQFGGK